MSDWIEIRVEGTPGPQGSKSFKGTSKAGHAIMVESSKLVRPWREAVMWAWRDLCLLPIPPQAICGPVEAQFIFTMRKPVSAPKRRRTWPSTKPDLSKLLRSTEDALTDVGAWEDDARVVEVSRLAKVYPGEDPDALRVPGCLIRIRAVHE